VYGVTGSGKTTLARKISERTGLPWHSVDDLAWEPGWVEVGLAEQISRFRAICAGDRWVMDTAYGKWIEVALSRAEVIVALDYPRWLSLSRLVRRTLWRSITRERVCNGNVEPFLRMLSEDSIIRWHFRSFARKRERMRRWAEDPGGPTVLLFSSPRQTSRWLAMLD
jgi:adenylate kinase family enzyme